MWRRLLCGGLLGGGVVLSGCGSSPNCATTTVLSVSPATGTATASAAAPGNEVQFHAVSQETLVHPEASGCALPALATLVQASWTSSDPVHVTVSSAADATNGLAVCHGATTGAATLTASTGTGATAQSATAQLTCK